MNESAYHHQPGLLRSPLPALNDPEGDCVPAFLPPVVDAHVHLFPDDIFVSIWKWFEKFGWPIRYKLKAAEVINFLLERGIEHIVALHYAHKPGVARKLNRFMAGLARQNPKMTAMATVFPGEKNTAAILQEAFSMGLAGVKLHAHVQCFDIQSDKVQEIYDICQSAGKPLVMHAGREPKSPAYNCDPYELCSAAKMEQVLKTYPRLKICVPHMGVDEFDAYRDMLERCDNLWLDTTMVLANYLPGPQIPPLDEMRADRIMYGTDFPNIPYAWDRELRWLCQAGMTEEALELILGSNAGDFFSFPR